MGDLNLTHTTQQGSIRKAEPSLQYHGSSAVQHQQYRRIDSPRQYQQPLPIRGTGVYAPSLPPGNNIPAGQPPSTGTPSVPVLASQTSPQSNYFAVAAGPYPNPSNLSESRAPLVQREQMAVHAVHRQAYPPMGPYHTIQASSPVSIQSPQQDIHGRPMYGQGFGFPHQLYYPQYALPHQQPYGAHMSPPGYPPISQANAAVLMSQHHASQTMQQSPMSQRVGVSPRLKMEQSPVERQLTGLGITQPSTNGAQNSASNGTSPSGATTNASAPGPIPATTPLVVRQDQDGVQWISFEYSRDRVKMAYMIRCDVESVLIDDLTQDFKAANCVYPRACGGKDQYKGNRLNYESECNAVGWALAELNPQLREKRGLIQRAVDSWRNSNQDPRLRSRRVRRQAKMSNRKQQLTQTAAHLAGMKNQSIIGAQAPIPMSAGQIRPPPIVGSASHMQHQDAHVVSSHEINGMSYM